MCTIHLIFAVLLWWLIQYCVGFMRFFCIFVQTTHVDIAPWIVHAELCPGCSFMKIIRGALGLWVRRGGVENRPLPLTWPMAYTTACTTVIVVVTVSTVGYMRWLRHAVDTKRGTCVTAHHRKDLYCVGSLLTKARHRPVGACVRVCVRACVCVCGCV